MEQCQCGCLGVAWHEGFGPRAAEMCRTQEVQKTTCPWRVTVSFQLLPRHGCAPDMFGGQAMRWGLTVGKYPPCVFLLAVILWLETEAAGLTDLGSLRLEGIMNTPGRAQGTWEFLKHSSSPLWASRGLVAARKRHKQCSPLPLRALC